MTEVRNSAALSLAQPTPAAPEDHVVFFAQVKSALKKELGETAWRSWISPVEFVSFSNGLLETSVPTRFIRDWVKTHYAERIKSLWQQQIGSPCRLDMTVQSAARKGAAVAANPTVIPFEHSRIANQNIDEAADVTGLSSPLDPRLTFSTFVVGAPNSFAANAARRVAESDTPVFNPLVLHGNVGTGKTHLLQAIAQDIRARRPRTRVAYMSAEKFMYQFIRALRFKDTLSFKEQLRGIDVLMIDDIQFICGKESTQEEFIHTFNALMDQGKQVIVSADRSPSDLDGLDERLRSRLSGGLVAAIEPATFDLRLAILRSKCALLNRMVPDDVLAFLAEKITASIRELEGALSRLIAHAELTGRELNIDSAQDLLQDLLRSNDRRLTVEDVQKAVCEHYGIRLADMHSPRRARPVARPRQMAMYLCKALTTHSLPDIGRRFGGRDHTTIIHGIRKIDELLKSDRQLQEDLDVLKRRLVSG